MRLPTTPFALAALTTLAMAVPTLAAPPEVGTSHTFLDPVFSGTIFCDTLEQVTAIATAEEPDATYADFVLTTNEVGEPTCLAIAPTAEVRAVTPLGAMTKGDLKFNAWAIEASIGGTTVYALYLEENNEILV